MEVTFTVQIKRDELGSEFDTDPTFAEQYFGGCDKTFNTLEQAQDYLHTFDDWEQDMLEISRMDWSKVKVPF
jgi:hypothetical protein